MAGESLMEHKKRRRTNKEIKTGNLSRKHGLELMRGKLEKRTESRSKFRKQAIVRSNTLARWMHRTNRHRNPTRNYPPTRNAFIGHTHPDSAFSHVYPRNSSMVPEILPKRVLFKPEGEIFFSDSGWVLSTDLTWAS